MIKLIHGHDALVLATSVNLLQGRGEIFNSWNLSCLDGHWIGASTVLLNIWLQCYSLGEVLFLICNILFIFIIIYIVSDLNIVFIRQMAYISFNPGLFLLIIWLFLVQFRSDLIVE